MVKDNYAGLLERIQEDVDVDEITPDLVAQWLAGHDNRGKTNARRRLGTQLAEIIQRERQIELSISIGEEFARKKRITLSEKFVAKEFKKWGRNKKPAIVIFDKRDGSRIKTWRYL